MAETINGITINKIAKSEYDSKVADGTITETMQREQIWLFTDNQHYSQDEKTKLAGIEAGAQVNPTKLSELSNDVSFITNTVNNLTNYYSKTEVNSMISGITTMAVEVVDTLPSAGEAKTIYLVPKTNSENQNSRDEYLYVNGAWEKIGDTTIDLSNYALKSEIPTKLSQLTNDNNYVSDSAYVHTDNNFTNDLKTKLDGVSTGAQVNVLEGIQVNGVDQTISNKKVNITVPTSVTKIW